MTSKSFEPDDLVWAKMKGFSHWPGKIIEPPADAKSKPKKNHHYVFFFGSDNHAWIPDDFIELHSEKLIEKYGKKKGGLFRSAVETIIDCSKNASKYHKSKESVEKQNSNDENFDKSSKSAGQSINSAPKKGKKKLSMNKEALVKSHSQEKKPVKRVHSPDQNEPGCSASFKSKVRKDSESELCESFTFDIFRHYSTSSKDEELKNKIPPQSPKLTADETHENPSPPLHDKIYSECPTIPPSDLMYQSEFLKKKKIEPTKSKIGFLGLSIIGQAIIKNLYHSGHSIIIWDYEPDECKKFTEKLKIKTVPTPADVVKAADIIFCCAPDSETAKELIFGDSNILGEIERSNKVRKGYVEMTPMDPKVSQCIGTEIRMKGGRYLEAPITGSRTEAIESTLLVITAGDKTLYDDCKSCLDAISKKNMFISAEVGAAAKLNIVHNMLEGTVYAALAESLSLCHKVGLGNFYEILEIGTLGGKDILQKVVSMSKRNYSPDTTLKQMQRDFTLGLALGNEISKRTMMFATANESYKRCKALNYGDQDVSAIFESTKP